MWRHISSSSFKATSVPGLLCQSGRRRPENDSIVSSLFPLTIALDQSAWEKKSIVIVKHGAYLMEKKLKGMKWYNFRLIRGTSTCEKRKKAVTSRWYPRSKAPKTVERWRESLRLLPLFNAGVYNVRFVFTRIRINPLLSYFQKIAHMSVVRAYLFVAFFLVLFFY